MENYTSPVVLENEELAEGVFTASGVAGNPDSSSDCWNVWVKSVQNDSTFNVFEVHASHSTDVTHITTQVTYYIDFNMTVPWVSTEFGDGFANVDHIEFTRDLHANGYHSGDEVTFKVWAYMNSHDDAVSVDIPNISYSCRHEVNVQGGID